MGAITTPAERQHPYRENGRKIRRARRLTGLSQQDFAVELGSSRRHLIRLENGQHLPSPPTRDRIVDLTGTTEPIDAYVGGQWAEDDDD
jgi:transcriptional regulator with XRE-family HTH domain